MGPRGRNVLLQKAFGAPTITKDGVSVAREIELKDTLENMGAQLVKEVASKTADEAGDGTTTATVLAHSVFKEGLRNVTAGANPISLKRGMDKATEAILAELKKASKVVANKTEIEQVATISANSDSAIGKMIAEAMDKVGKDGVITVEEAKGISDELEVVEGMQFDRGYLSPYFITNADKMIAEFNNPFILLYEKKISSLKEMLPILEAVNQSGRPLVIIAEDVDGEALATLVVNRLRGSLNIAAVKAPGFGDRRKAMLQDIAVLTRATVVSEEMGMKLDTCGIEVLGTASKIVIDKDNTTIVDGSGDAEGVKARVAEGIVIGGGAALIRASQNVRDLYLTDEERIGADIIFRAIKAPLKQIVANAGYDSGVIINNIISSEDNIGFNAATGEYVDMFESGIIDPYKVERVALLNAVSVASLLLTTEATVTFVDEKKDI